jgi:hypothetical protein
LLLLRLLLLLWLVLLMLLSLVLLLVLVLVLLLELLLVLVPLLRRKGRGPECRRWVRHRIRNKVLRAEVEVVREIPDLIIRGRATSGGRGVRRELPTN